MTRKALNALDRLVGHRLRQLRELAGLSQMQLGDALGLSGLEVANLEAGLDRIGSGRLHRIARILDVPVAVFFETPDKLTEPQCREQSGPPLGHEEGELVSAFRRITDPEARRALLALVRVAGVQCDRPANSEEV